MIDVKDKLLWDYLDGKLPTEVENKISRLLEADKSLQRRFRRISVLNELIQEEVFERMDHAPDMSEAIMKRLNRASYGAVSNPTLDNGIVYLFLIITTALLLFGMILFPGLFRGAEVGYAVVKSIGPVCIYSALISITIVISSVMAFDLIVCRRS